MSQEQHSGDYGDYRKTEEVRPDPNGASKGKRR